MAANAGRRPWPRALLGDTRMMREHVGTTPVGRRGISCLLAACVCASAAATAADVKSASVENGSFEEIRRLAVPPQANAIGQWILKSGLQAPVAWRPSPSFPGELEVRTGDAADGERFLHVAAGPRRAAHLAQPCPGLRRGLAYEVSLRYRGGPVELKVYEYDGKGKLKSDRAFARGEPTPLRRGPWLALRGVYRMPRAGRPRP